MDVGGAIDVQEEYKEAVTAFYLCSLCVAAATNDQRPNNYDYLLIAAATHISQSTFIRLLPRAVAGGAIFSRIPYGVSHY